MAEVASAYVTLIPSAKGFAAGIQGQIGTSMVGVGRRAGVDAGVGMKAGVASMATKVFAPLAAAAAALKLGDLLGDAVTAGSDFQQAVGGTDAVFKDNARNIKDSADDAAKSLGLSKTAYLELATVVGAGLKNKGIKDYAKQTESLIGLGADLAAQFGGDTQSAVDAISSLMRGEADPIERYGVSINETAVNSYLAANGQDKLKGKALELAKAQARVKLLFDQTADAQGAFAREADTYAGKQQRLSASWDDIKTQVGTALLPALTRLSDWFLTDGLPAIQEFGNWAKDELWPALKDGWETVQPGLKEAKEIIAQAFGGENSDLLKELSTLLTEVLIPAFAEFVNVYLPIMARGWQIAIVSFRTGLAVFEAVREGVRRMATFVLNAFSGIINAGADLLEALSSVPGFGWAKDAADKMRGAAEKADSLRDAINGIPNFKTVNLTVDTKYNLPSRINVPGVGYVNPGIVGARAKGGPVKAGDPYIVGEKGPELIVPKRNGTVIPNHDLANGSALPSGGGFDYRRMGDVLADSVAQVRPVVDTRDNARQVARLANQRAALA